MEILSFDVGGSSVKYAVINEVGTFREQGSFVTPADGMDHLLQELKNVCSLQQGRYDLAGAGFSLPGAVDEKTGCIGGASAIDYIHGFDIRSRFQAALGMPVTMENDANCAALGELWQGAARGCKDVLFLVIGSGVGGAVIKDGRIHHGAHLHGGEFGFMVVDDAGMILSEAAATVPMTRRLAEAKGIPAEEMDGRRAFALREAGDAAAIQAIDFMYDHLARAIYNLQYAYDPELVVLGGAISARPELVPELEARIGRLMQQVQIAKIVPQVVCCKAGNAANLLGAALHFLQQRDAVC